MGALGCRKGCRFAGMGTGGALGWQTFWSVFNNSLYDFVTLIFSFLRSKHLDIQFPRQHKNTVFKQNNGFLK
jgi:hypothetical protein